MARKQFLMTGRGSREGAMDGLNLFFGALLGANLGTLEGLKLVSYVQLATLLAGTVMALRIVSTAEQRGRALIVLGIYGLLLVALVKVPALAPRGMETDDLNKLVATLAVWMSFVLILEFVASRRSAAAPDEPPAA